MEEFKGNPIPAEKPKEKAAPVTTNVTVKKEGSLARKFFAQDLKSTGANVFNETIIPGAKKILSDIVKKSIDFLLYGTFSNTGNYTDYRGITTQKLTSLTPVSQYTVPPQNYSRPATNNVYNVNVVEFDERGDAEEVLRQLQMDCNHFGMVSIADFYDKFGWQSNFTDNDWGWKNLDNAYVQRLMDGKYKIIFPRIESLK